MFSLENNQILAFNTIRCLRVYLACARCIIMFQPTSASPAEKQGFWLRLLLFFFSNRRDERYFHRANGIEIRLFQLGCRSKNRPPLLPVNPTCILHNVSHKQFLCLITVHVKHNDFIHSLYFRIFGPKFNSSTLWAEKLTFVSVCIINYVHWKLCILWNSKYLF